MNDAREKAEQSDPVRLVHVLWTKAVGQPDYVKAEWRDLEAFVMAAAKEASPSLRSRVEGLTSGVSRLGIGANARYRDGYEKCRADVLALLDTAEEEEPK